MLAGNVKQITTRAVAEHQNGPRHLNVPSLKMHQARVVDTLHNLQLALEAHLDAILRRSAARAVLTYLDGH